MRNFGEKEGMTDKKDYHFCRDGGIGRHEGLKILWPETAVWVQVPLAVLRNKKESTCKFTCEVFSFWLLQVLRGTYVESPTLVFFMQVPLLNQSTFPL